MGQRPIVPSLAEAALQAGDIEGLLALHKSIFGGFRMELDGDGDGEDGADDGDSGDGSDDGDGDGDGSGDGDGEEIKNPKLKALSEENARKRNEAKAEKARADSLAAKLKEYEDADKSEIEKITGERDELKGSVEKLKGVNNQLALKIAFLESNTHSWHNPKAALRLLDLDGVEIDEEGEVTGMDDAVKRLAKDHPYLIKKADSDDDGDGVPGSGQPPKQRRQKQSAQREGLEKTYPALRNR